MVFLTSVLLLIFAFIGYLRTRNYISPTVLSPLSWGLVLFLYAILDHGMDDITPTVLGIILIWNFSLLSGAWFFIEAGSKYNLGNRKKRETGHFNKYFRNMYFWISVVGIFPILYISYMQGMSLGDTADFFFNLRMANTGLVETEYSYGIWQYVFTFSFVSFLIEIFSYQKGDKKTRIYILLLINILLAIVTMAKSSFFFLFLSIIFSIMFKRKIPKRTLIIGFSILIVIMSFIQLVRAGNEDNVISNMFYSYILGGVPALDKIVNSQMHSSEFGQMTLRFFNTISNALIGGKSLSKDVRYNYDITQEGYIYMPMLTNVYTVIGPFWLDFGYKGVVIFSFIIGSISGYSYRLAVKNELWAVISYSFLACTLVLQFFGEYLFTNLSYTIQIFLLTYFAFKFKFRWQK